MAIWTKIAVDNYVIFYRSYVHSSLDITCNKKFGNLERIEGSGSD